MHWLLFTIVLAFLSIGYWADNAILDEVTRGEGRIIPSSQIQVIQSLEGGIISDVLVHEGDHVQQGQPLMQLDHTRFSSNLEEVRSEQLHLMAKLARLQSEAHATPFTPPAVVNSERPIFIQNEQRLLDSRQSSLESSIEILRNQHTQKQHELEELQTTIKGIQEQFKLAKKEIAIAEPLTQKGILPEIEFVRLEREAAELKSQLLSSRSSIPRLKATIRETEQQIDRERTSFKARALDEVNRVQAALLQLEEKLPALNDQLQRTEIRSPINGTIKQIHTQNLGGIIQPGGKIMEIVPQTDQLLVEAEIRPSDIAFLHPGQSAHIKLTAYDSTIYGGLAATLEHISADTIQGPDGTPYYLIRLTTEAPHLQAKNRTLPIMPGMVATVEILTGQKSVLDYLLKPLLKTKENAFSER